jgi:phage FluMu gp28-like protein
VRHRFLLGVDIGQSADFTALVVIERVGEELHARHVQRLPLGMSYPEQVKRITAIVGSPELARDVLVAVDGTGVGRAVVDLLREALRPFHAPLVSISITGGLTASHKRAKWSVPKRDLIGVAQVALQTKRLKIASALPTAQTLVDELTAYRVSLSEDGHDSYGNGREAPNDDLVLALAIATYASGRRVGGARIVHAGPDKSFQRPRGELANGVFGYGGFR